ncbi:MAG: hypothetical protein D4R79_12440 [Comamonadaceae bacterium]|nr:MAG: hypothetical protein D4R79_12440 [Comamonadaceae bacterium]
MKFETMGSVGFQSFRSALTLCALAILAACSSQQSPNCNDPSVSAALEKNVNEIVESELSEEITEPTLLASARKVFQLHVEGLRTTSIDHAKKRVTCTGTLVASLNPSAGKEDHQTRLRSLARNMGLADTAKVDGARIRTEIHFAAVSAADTQALSVGLTERSPLVHRLATMARMTSPESGLPMGVMPSNLLELPDVGTLTTVLLDQVYGPPDKNLGCRLVSAGTDLYCMEFAHSVIKKTVDGKLLYAVATGHAINSAHVTPGLVEAFIVDDKGGKARLAAKSPRLQMGSWGEAPNNWKLKLLGAKGNWGWTAHEHYQQNGFSIDETIFLGQHDGSIHKLAQVPTDYDDTGNCEDKKCERSMSAFKSSVRTESVPSNAAFYPLLVTVNGSYKGKQIKSTTWKLVLDERKHQYDYPQGWPLIGLFE